MAVRSEEHALLNNVVLDTVFGFLPDFSDLTSARLVCQAWRKGSLKGWRKAGVLVLLQKKNKSPKTRGAAGGVGGGSGLYLSISELVSLIEEDGGGGGHNSGGFELDRRPYQNVRLKEWKFYGGDSFWEEHVFRDRLGASLTYLHLDRCTFQRLSVVEDLLLSSVPNLQTLVWSDCKVLDKGDEVTNWYYSEGDDAVDADDDGEDGDPIPEEDNNVIMIIPNDGDGGQQEEARRRSAVKILQVTCDSDGDWRRHNLMNSFLTWMPTLEELKLCITQAKRDEDIDDAERSVLSLLNAIYIINVGRRDDAINNYDKFPIRNLELMDYFTDATYDFLSDWTDKESILDLGLERLTIDVGAWAYQAQAEHIFGANRDTLKVLKAFRAPIYNPANNLTFRTVPFTKEMSALEELHLWGNFTTNLEFLKYTPNLQTLVLKTDCFDKRHKLESALKNREHHLERYMWDLVDNTLRAFRRRRRGIPARKVLSSVESLVHLDIDYSFCAETISTVALWLPNVSTLKMVLTSEKLEAVSRAWPGLTELELLFGSEVGDVGIRCLLQLSNLKTFKSNAYCDEAMLTSSSVNQVFLKMKTLKSLEICVSSEMSIKAETALKKNIAHVKVIRNYDLYSDQYYHPIQECCYRNKFRWESAMPVTPKVRRAARRTE